MVCQVMLTILVGTRVVRAGGAGLGGGCGSPGAWTAALALDFLPSMSHKRETPKSEEACNYMDFTCAKGLICVRNEIHMTSKYTLLRV